jgi:hypothetical protein
MLCLSQKAVTACRCAGVEPKPLIQPFGERLSFKHNLVQRCVRSACVCGLICFCVSCGWELVPRTSAAPPLGGRGSAAEHTGLPGADVRKVPAQMCAKSWRRCVQSPGADVGSAGTADRRKCGADVRRALHGTCGRGRMRGAVLGNPSQRMASAGKKGRAALILIARTLTPITRTLTPITRALTPIARTLTPITPTLILIARTLTPITRILTPIARTLSRRQSASTNCT